MGKRDAADINIIKAVFLDALREKGVQGLLEAAAGFFACPALLLDESFRLLACAPRLPQEDGGLWLQLARAGALPAEAMWPLLRQYMPQTESGGAVYVPQGIFAGEPLLFGPWQPQPAGSELRGYLLLCLGQQALPEGGEELAATLLYLLGLQAGREGHNPGQWSRQRARQLQLLLRAESAPNQREAAQAALAAGLKGRYAVLVTPVGQGAAQQAFGEYAAREVQRLYGETASVVFEGSVVTLLGGLKFRPTDPIVRPANNRLAADIFAYFEKYNLKSGLSSSFQDLRQLRGYYRQGLLAARLANAVAFKTPAVFLELMPLPLFAAALEADPEQIFLHPVLPQLRAYDRAHGTDYERTLRVYELCLRDREQAAERLSVHKNTLKYRLERIEELFYLPLDDSWTNLNLLCASLLLELQPQLADRDPAASSQKKELMAYAAPLLDRSFFTGREQQ